MSNFEKIGNTADYDGYGTSGNGIDLGEDDERNFEADEPGTSKNEGPMPGENIEAAADDIAFEAHLKKLAEQKKKTGQNTLSADAVDLGSAGMESADNTGIESTGVESAEGGIAPAINDAALEDVKESGGINNVVSDGNIENDKDVPEAGTEMPEAESNDANKED